MGQMALGYGSEFHLLRWMGRHRNEFDQRIKQLLSIDNIIWKDFDFKCGKPIPDEELKGISFLKNDPNYQQVSSLWKNEWPQRGNSMNWDLVGYFEQNNEKTWLLVEAKAHIGELTKDCGATSEESYQKISNALENTANFYGIEIPPQNPWEKNYYQLANRIYMIHLLKRCGIEANLINIYFIGDLSSKNRNSPQSEDEWLPEIKKMKQYLGIQDAPSMGIIDLFLEIAY